MVPTELTGSVQNLPWIDQIIKLRLLNYAAER